jgi:uncharacterized damage-inducible protein DinB
LAAQFQTQQGFLDAFQDDAARFQRIILALDDEQQQVAFTPEGWSVKDFLAHMSHWKAATVKVLVAYTHDQPLPPVMPSGDKANAEAREMDKELSLPQVRNYWEKTNTQLIHLIADDLDDEKLQEEVRAPWGDEPLPICTILSDICAHDAEHFELIEQYFEIADQPGHS